MIEFCGQYVKFMNVKSGGTQNDLKGIHNYNKLAYLGFHCLDHPPYSPDLSHVRLPPVPWTEKTIERSPFFVRRRGQCCRGDLVGWENFWIFFEWRV